MKRGLRAAAVAVLALWAAACAKWIWISPPRALGPPESFAIPFEGPGQLASIWSWWSWQWDDPRSGKTTLVLAGGGQTRCVDLEEPGRVRWRSPEELIVEHSIRPLRNRSGTRILRLSPEGEVLEVLSDREGLGVGEPSPDGRWLALSHFDPRGLDIVEIRDLDDGFALLAEHRAPGTSFASSLGIGKIWSPDGSHLALAVQGWISREEAGRLTVRTAIVAPDRPGYALLPDRVPGEDRGETGGLRPLFWTERGIYGVHQKDSRRLLRCDPWGGGCRPVYAVGRHRWIVSGRPAGADTALLLVHDLWLDPFETRSKEIHQVDLATGEGGLLLRLPPGVFISDIDWSPDPRGE